MFEKTISFGTRHALVNPGPHGRNLRRRQPFPFLRITISGFNPEIVSTKITLRAFAGDRRRAGVTALEENPHVFRG